MRRCILHGHIFKNAGTTLDWSLKRSFGARFREDRRDVEMRRRPQQYLQELLQEDEALGAISSHCMPAAPPQLAAVEFLDLYLLRHPLQRVESVYRFERKQRAGTPGARAAKEKTFLDYVAWRMEGDVGPTIRNYHARYLAGQHTRRPGWEVDRAAFQRAVDKLFSATCVGLVERYDESMVVFEARLAEAFPAIDLAYVPQNVRPGPREESVLRALGERPGLQQQVVEKNGFDLALYELARQRLEDDMAAVEGFADRLAEFRERCAKLRRFGLL